MECGNVQWGIMVVEMEHLKKVGIIELSEAWIFMNALAQRANAVIFMLCNPSPPFTLSSLGFWSKSQKIKLLITFSIAEMSDTWRFIEWQGAHIFERTYELTD